MTQPNLKLSVFYGIINILVLNLVLALICDIQELNSYFFSTFPVFSVLWLILAPANNLYNFSRNSNYRLRLLNYVKCHFAFSGILVLICFSFDLHNQFKAVTIPLIIAYPIINLSTVAVLMYTIGYMRSKGRNVKKILIVGTGTAALQLFRYIESNPDLGYRIVGMLSDNNNSVPEKLPVTGSWEILGDVLCKFKLNEIFVTIPSSEQAKISIIVQQADFFGVRMRLVPDYDQLLGNSFSTAIFGDLPVINVRAISLDKHYLSIVKRIFDIAFSVLAIIFLAPLMLLLMLVIALDSSGPIFYCPVRIGKGGKEFKLYKFRSMYTEYSDPVHTGSTKKDDPRLTFVGGFIRRYSLDELPQFFNVLFGDMSVVGPRPHRILLNKAMQKEVDNYMLRHYLKPGITGWAQVNGWRGPTETEEERTQRTNHDLWYVNNWSLALDMRIVYLTVFDPKTHKKAF